MATSTAAIEAFAQATGIPHVTMSHIARLLRQERGELWPRSGRGGGKGARHVEPQHAANLILSLAAIQPSDGPAAVTELGIAVCSIEKAKRVAAGSACYEFSELALREFSDNHNRRYPLELREMLVLLIRRVAAAKAAGREGERLLKVARRNWALWLALDTSSAWVSWTDEDGRKHEEHYSPPGRTLPQLFSEARAPVDILVVVPFTLVEVAAELWNDTISQRDGLPTMSPDARASRPRMRRGAPPSSASPPKRTASRRKQ